MTNSLHNAAVTMLIALAFSAAPARAQLSVDRVITFGVPSDRLRAQVREIPEAREVAAGDFVMAGADLDSDGKPEAIVLERRPADCRNIRCGLLVMRGTTSGGAEVLLLTRVAVPLALTLERVNGYRALVALGANGEVAVGDRRDAELAGKPLVYVMRTNPGARAPAAPSEKTPSTAATLETFIAMLALPVGSRPLDTSPDAKWELIAKLPYVKWRDREPRPRGRDYIRAGTVPLKGLGVTSVVWEGLPDTAITADVRTGTRLSPDKYEGVLKEHFSSNVKLRSVRGGCKDEANSAIYEATIPGKQPIYLRLNAAPNWNDGNTTIQVSSDNESRWAC